MMEVYLTALMIGLVGSFHCIGMCGPIAFALPIGHGSRFRKIVGSTVYNSGRIITYFLFGLVFGGIGYGLSTATGQQSLSIALGVLFVIAGLVPRRWTQKLDPASKAGYLINKLKSGLGTLMSSSRPGNLLLIGLLNGLLPCGLVYAAIGGAIATSSTIQGGLFMAAFGLGTFPVMFLAVLLSNVITLRLRNRIRRLVPVFIVLLGFLFILRGLDLGIPYLSPKYNVEQKTMECCKD